MSELLILCLEFFKAGLFAVGGGLATLPFLHEMALHYDWFTEAELADMIAVAESTPGPIGVNMATYAGYKACGIVGGIAATLSLVLPSYIIILIVSKFLDKFRESPIVESAFIGLRPCVAALVLAAGFSVFKVSILTWDAFTASGSLSQLVSPVAAALFAIILAATLIKKDLPPVVLIAFGAVAGIVLQL